jgi:hypothetical protein
VKCQQRLDFAAQSRIALARRREKALPIGVGVLQRGEKQILRPFVEV